MSTRSTYPAGVPCWISLSCPDDAESAKSFYTALFGWTYEDIVTPQNPPFYIATLHGDRVAGIAGSGNGEPGRWITAVSVPDADAVRAVVADAGGSAPPEHLTDIATLGRFCRLHDPAGTEVYAVQIDGRVAQRVNEPGAWSMSTLRAAHRDAVIPFYEAVFGWRAETEGPATMFRLPDYVGGEPDQPVPRDVVAVMEQTDGPDGTDGTGSAWVIDMWVDDAVAAAETALAHGGQVLVDPHETEAGFMAADLADPSGARLTISQRLEPR